LPKKRHKQYAIHDSTSDRICLSAGAVVCVIKKEKERKQTMSEYNNNDAIDLGSDPVVEEFDPFADDDTTVDDTTADNTTIDDTSTVTDAPPTDVPVPTTPPVPESEVKTEEKPQHDYAEKPPVFEYAGATESIEDASKTFDELRIEKSVDFPELEDGKRVSWTVEYGKITKAVADPKGLSIGKMKSDIEASKAFQDALKKPRADKSPVCKVKPRVTAQSKGLAAPYKGVSTTMEDAEASGKAISIVPARDGTVYEIRNTKMGRFVTPIAADSPGGCDLLSDVRAGFTPALPRIPMNLMLQIISFFRSYMSDAWEREVLINIYWDQQTRAYVVDAPEQTVTKASVDSHENLAYVDDRYIHYMDIHSHNSMKAFFSEIDDRDEKATRLYTVVGHLNEYFPDVKTRISNGGKFLYIEPSEVFETVAAPFPDEWKDRVHYRSSHNACRHKAFQRPGKEVDV
jgi:PRTRC genetic system protein A